MAALPLATDGGRSAPAADRVPTLTEVVELGQQPEAAVADIIGSHASQPLVAASARTPRVTATKPPADRPPVAAPTLTPAPLPDMQELSAAVLAELQPRVELLFEGRIREAVAPALARAADGLIRDTREQLAATLQALVHETVAKVLEQRRQR